MYTIRPIAKDGEVYAAYGTEYFMDVSFPLALRLRARECYDPRHLDNRWDKFCIVPPRLPVERLGAPGYQLSDLRTFVTALALNDSMMYTPTLLSSWGG